MTRRFAASMPAQAAPGAQVALTARMARLPDIQECPSAPSVGSMRWYLPDGAPEPDDPRIVSVAYEFDQNIRWVDIEGYAVAEAGITWACDILYCEADADAPTYTAPGMLGMSPTGESDSYTNAELLESVGGLPWPTIVLAGVVPVVINTSGFDGQPCVVRLTPSLNGAELDALEVRYFPGMY